MQVGKDPPFHLTYCTNIHPGNGWGEVFANLRRYAPELKKRLSPGRRFGLGLRLSSKESEELLQGENLERFRRFLAEEGLYVFTLNGFPFGPFHGERIKSAVFAPDWRDPARTEYTLRLIDILKALLPEGVEGGISTAPLSYRRWIRRDCRDDWEAITRQIVRVAERLIRVERAEGQRIHLDIEPEPDGLVERSAEVVAFFEWWLLPAGAALLAKSLGLSTEEARASLLNHIRVCLDTCHMAVMYESPEAILERFSKVGIRIGKVQISAALEVALPDELSTRLKLREQLQPFAESTYLHQVVEEKQNGLYGRYPDLEDALAVIQAPHARKWRIHFHVPLFVGSYGSFRSTRPEVRSLLRLLQGKNVTRHLEIETYTWKVLPDDLKVDLTDSIEREYRWVVRELEGASLLTRSSARE